MLVVVVVVAVSVTVVAVVVVVVVGGGGIDGVDDVDVIVCRVFVTSCSVDRGCCG